MTAKAKHVELKNLSKSVKTSIYDMLKLADEILSDAEYVALQGGEDTLIDAMNDDEFAHFGSDPDLKTLLFAYRANPAKKVWLEYRCNVRAMIDLATPATETRESGPRTNWRAKADGLEAENERLKAEVESLKTEVSEIRGELRAAERYAARAA